LRATRDHQAAVCGNDNSGTVHNASPIWHNGRPFASILISPGYDT
jgi:hypothetical protein